jgi:hypothetical protein
MLAASAAHSDPLKHPPCFDPSSVEIGATLNGAMIQWTLTKAQAPLFTTAFNAMPPESGLVADEVEIFESAYWRDAELAFFFKGCQLTGHDVNGYKPLLAFLPPSIINAMLHELLKRARQDLQSNT